MPLVAHGIRKQETECGDYEPDSSLGHELERPGVAVSHPAAGAASVLDPRNEHTTSKDELT
jgi:hypothetical protein